MKLLIPIVLVLVGLGAGAGAGLMLKPPPPVEEPHDAAKAACPEGSTEHCDPAAAADPYEAPAKEGEHGKSEEEQIYVAFEKPFVIPIFKDDKVVAMVVVSLSNAVGKESESAVKAAEPLLRDAYLKVMFRHANSGGFDGSFTAGQKMRDLKSGLLEAAKNTLPEPPISEVLITDIARQDT